MARADAGVQNLRQFENYILDLRESIGFLSIILCFFGPDSYLGLVESSCIM